MLHEFILKANSFKDEAAATTFLEHHLKTSMKSLRLYKIPDDGRGERPFDIIGVCQGIAIAIEGKFCRKLPKDPYTYTLGLLAAHQCIHLGNIKKYGGQSYIFLYVQENQTFYFFHFKE